MKQITEIDDPRLVKALAHPLRINILRVLQDRIASPSEIAEELGAPLGNVSYHVRYLERFRVIELVRTRPRRGAVEHYYRAVGRLRITDKAWAEVPQVVKDALLQATLDQIAAYVGAAASIGGFEPDASQVKRMPMVVDEQGFSDLSDAVRQLLERASEIESRAAERIAAGDSHDGELSAGLVMLLFQAPERSGEQTPAQQAPVRRRAAKRRRS